MLYQNDESMFYSCVSNEFYFALRACSTWRSAQTYEKFTIFKYVSGLNHFTKVLGEIKKCLIFEFHEMITVSHLVACPIVFALLCDLRWQGGVLNSMEIAQF